MWSKEAFGDFHGFVSGWLYWIYTIFYFPGLLLASTAMSGYVAGSGGTALAQNRTFLMAGSFVLLIVAVTLNIIGLNIGKWLQNAGGVATYVPLLMLVGIAALVYFRQGSITHFTVANMLPHWNWDTVNFWSQIAFAFAGLELVSAMSEEVKDPRRTLPRAVLGSGVLIAAIYVAGTFAVLSMMPAEQVDPSSGVFSGAHGGFDGAALGIPRSPGGDFSVRRECRWRGEHRRRNCARPIRCGHRPVLAGGVRENSSAVENALRVDPGAGGAFRRGIAGEPDQ